MGEDAFYVEFRRLDGGRDMAGRENGGTRRTAVARIGPRGFGGFAEAVSTSTCFGATLATSLRRWLHHYGLGKRLER